HSSPPTPVMNSEMPLVSAEELVRSLTNQRNFYVFACSLRNKIHRHDRRRCDRFFETVYDFWKRSFELRLVDLNCNMPSPQNLRGFRCILQFIILEAIAISDRVSRPRSPMFVHQ